MLDPNSISSDEDGDATLLAAEADIAAGRTVAFDDVERWLKSWGTNSELPAPEFE